MRMQVVPCGELVPYILILPKSGDHLTIDTQATSNESKLTITVGRLIQVHEIHIDLGPWQIAIELSMQMGQWFL